MKKNLLIALAATVAGTFGSAAQVYLDGSAAAIVQAATDAAAASSRSGESRLIPAPVNLNSNIAVVVKISDASVAQAMAAVGANVVSVRDNLALVSLTPAQLVKVSQLKGVQAIESGYQNRPMMNNARVSTKVDVLHAGTGLDKAYDGTGVICGLMDIGLDPNHINFQNEDGTSRISRMWVITGSNGAIDSLVTPDRIKNYTTDNSAETHGTHVLGIMAGGYKGKATNVAIINERTQSLQTKRDYAVPFYGIATGAELAPCAGTLDGNNILIAAEKIYSYSRAQGKPAVMNLSLGHNWGPHDGSTISGQFLDKLGKEMIICVSAGNEGDANMSVEKKFTATDNKVATFAYNPYNPGAKGSVSSMVDVWFSDDAPAKFTFKAVNPTNKEEGYSITIDKFDGNSLTIVGSKYASPSYIRDPKFNDAFGSDSYIIIRPSVSSNGRKNVSMTLMLSGNGTYAPVLEAEGSEGQTVNIYGSGTGAWLKSYGLMGYSDGSPAQSINDMACGHNVLSVASYCNAQKFPTLGGMMSGRNAVGNISSFSSYGVTNDGRTLPLIAGPGENVIASYSQYYVEKTDADKGKYAAAKNLATEHNSYWQDMSGTSMSSPAVAGIMALWLQADPTLNIDRVKEVLKETSVRDAAVEAAPNRFGYGKIDALEGIKKVIAGSTGVSDVTVESNILVSTPAAGAFDIFCAGAPSVQAVVYSLAGEVMAQAAAAGEQLNMETSLPAGVYILKAAAGAQTVSRKIVVR